MTCVVSSIPCWAAEPAKPPVVSVAHSSPHRSRWASALLNAFLDLRKSSALGRIYRLFPKQIRARVSRLAWGQLTRRVAFPPLCVQLPEAQDSLVAADTPAQRWPAEVNMFGFFGGQFGLGESARLYARALASQGVSVAARDVDLQLPHEWVPFKHPSMEREISERGVDFVVVNPDYFERALPMIRAAGGCGKPMVGVWFWELGEIPDSWLPAIDRVDGVLVASRFVEDAFRRCTTKPVACIPIPLMSLPDSGLRRRDFGLPEHDFLILTTFDFHSSVHRKNPRAAIDAFQRAFPPSTKGVGLVVKSVNGSKYPEALSALVAHSSTDPRVVVRDGVLSQSNLGALQETCDAYLSLHRAEGFGLGMAECMARGKPVVATGWSGNMDFMTPDVACLVDYELVPVGTGAYLGGDGSLWAEPKVEQAADYLRRIHEDRDFARDLGLRARDHVRRLLSPAQVAERFSEMCMSLGRNDEGRTDADD